MEPSPLLAPPTPQKTPALQQDRVMEEFETETLSEPLMPIEDRSLDNETPICQVQPLLGTTIYSYGIETDWRTSQTYWELLHFKGM